MIFFIDESYKKYFERPPYDSDALSVVLSLLNARKEALHMLISTRRMFNFLESVPALDDPSRRLCAKLARKMTTENGILDHASFYVLIRHGTKLNYIDRDDRGRRVLNISPDQINKSSFFQKSRLLTEDITDAKIYKAICKAYLYYENINIEVDMDFLSGGGTRISDIYKEQIQKSDNFCLCIVDSDRKSPNGKLGANASKIQKTPTNNFCFSKILNAKEIENLFSLATYKMVYAKNTDILNKIELLEKFSKDDFYLYLDLRSGFSLHQLGSLTDVDDKKYIMKKINQFSLVTSCKSVPICTSKDSCSCMVTNAIANDLIKQLISVIDLERDKQLLFSKQPDLVLGEWKKIYSEMLSWFCTPQKLRA